MSTCKLKKVVGTIPEQRPPEMGRAQHEDSRLRMRYTRAPTPWRSIDRAEAHAKNRNARVERVRVDDFQLVGEPGNGS